MNKYIVLLSSIILFLVIICSTKCSAQAIDSLQNIEKKSVDTASSNTNYNKIVEKTASKDSFGAVWRSLLVPGWGQYYVESYWKAPIALGASVYFWYGLISNHSNFISASQAVDNAVASGIATDRDLFLLRTQREIYRDQRDAAGLYLTVTYLLSAVDAYVGAHLFDFDVSENVSAHWGILQDNGRIGISLRLK